MRQIKNTPKYILLFLFALIQLVPLYWLLTYSLKTNAEILGENVLGLPYVPQWSNYVKALTSAGILKYFMNSVFFSFFTVVIVGFLSSMASYAITRMKWKLSFITFLCFSIGIMIPTHAALLPLFQVLDAVGLKGGRIGLLLPYVSFALPMSIMILSSFLKAIPKEMEEAACLDGCGIYRTFFMIIFPMIKPALATASIFTFLGTWNELLFANTLLDNDATRTLPAGIMAFSGVYMTDLGLIGAGLVIATIPTIFIYILLSNKVQESLVSGAVKG